VLGYDVAVRLGAATTARRLAHQNGQWPMLGAVAAGARLRGFDAAQVSRAIRIGATLLLTPSYTNVVAGATALNVAGGMCGLVGVLAPELTLAGFEAQPDAVEQVLGGMVADGFDPERATEQLGERWEIGRNHLRLRACCNPIYPALDALEAALADLRPRPDEIERIDVATFAFASVMNEAEPPNPFAAKYSLPHAAAAIAVRGRADLEAFGEAALRDPAIAALRRKVRLVEDPELTRQVPRLKPARVTLTLRDGRTSTRSCETSRGGFDRPYARDELLAKFRELAGSVLTPEGVTEVEALVADFERVEDAGALAALVQQHSR